MTKKKEEFWPTTVKPGWRLIYRREGIHFITYVRPSSFRTREPDDDEIGFAMFSIDCHINRLAFRAIRFHSDAVEIDDFFGKAAIGINFHLQVGVIIDLLWFHIAIGKS